MNLDHDLKVLYPIISSDYEFSFHQHHESWGRDCSAPSFAGSARYGFTKYELSDNVVVHKLTQRKHQSVDERSEFYHFYNLLVGRVIKAVEKIKLPGVVRESVESDIRNPDTLMRHVIYYQIDATEFSGCVAFLDLFGYLVTLASTIKSNKELDHRAELFGLNMVVERDPKNHHPTMIGMRDLFSSAYIEVHANDLYTRLTPLFNTMKGNMDSLHEFVVMERLIAGGKAQPVTVTLSTRS